MDRLVAGQFRDLREPLDDLPERDVNGALDVSRDPFGRFAHVQQQAFVRHFARANGGNPKAHGVNPATGPRRVTR
ncbi:hypothetical protein GCM10022227_47670 [Streptomyces sedi]